MINVIKDGDSWLEDHKSSRIGWFSWGLFLQLLEGGQKSDGEYG